MFDQISTVCWLATGSAAGLFFVDVEQRMMFTDTIVVAADRDQPLATKPNIFAGDLASCPSGVGRRSTSIREHFDRLFDHIDSRPLRIAGSRLLIPKRELLSRT